MMNGSQRTLLHVTCLKPLQPVNTTYVSASLGSGAYYVIGPV